MTDQPAQQDSGAPESDGLRAPSTIGSGVLTPGMEAYYQGEINRMRAALQYLRRELPPVWRPGIDHALHG